jgi:hypothetical protein
MIENKKQNKRGPYSTEGKNCIVCFRDLDTNNTRAADIAQANYICKICRQHRDKSRYMAKKEIIREQQRAYDRANKIKIIKAYGSKCICCGETILEFLTIDHINSNDMTGSKENKHGSGSKLYRWLIKNNFPKEGYQLLCYNCNGSKYFFGYCPHSKTEIIIRPLNPLNSLKPLG